MDAFPLYDPAFEHDACGVGFVAHLSAQPSSLIVQSALRALCNLAHRGAVAADAQTGDGAGILTGLPTAFFLARVDGLTERIEREEDLGAGMLFMPRTDTDAYGLCRAFIEHVLRARNLRLLGWRTVPTDLAAIGEAGAASAPLVQQVFVKRPHGMMRETFERTLFLARKDMERHAARAGMKDFYACSFSSRTIVYKGLMLGGALDRFYPDLRDPLFTSSFAVYHQRYSTNTFPTWHLAQPFRMLGHNGEINTIQGNRRWTEAREAGLASEVWGEDLRALRPILQAGGSDSANLDNVLELLTLSGRTAQHAMLMLIPEAWQQKSDMNPRVREFFEFQECFSEPWDGPAAVVFADGRVVGATLDRNGLRPARYKITADGLIYLGSEAGALPMDDARVVEKGKLGPGEMILVDLERKLLLRDLEIKQELSRRRPYGDWLRENMIRLRDRTDGGPAALPRAEREELVRTQVSFGYTDEDLQTILRPMMTAGEEPIGSMGDDAPIAVLSTLPRLLPSYFKQQFAQVTNPPLDPIRERLVMSLSTNIGPRRNWLGETPAHARQVRLESPVLFEHELDAIRALDPELYGHAMLPMLFPAERGEAGMREALDALEAQALEAAEAGRTVLVLSDRGVDAAHAAIPSLLGVGAVHSQLLRKDRRLALSIVVETGEPRDVHQIATLIGYGANAVCPYLALDSIRQLVRIDGGDADAALAALGRYRKGLEKGLLKIISKMGISLLGSYRGAQIFEALGLSDEIVERYFPGTPSRIGGITLADIAREACVRHAAGFGGPAPSMADPGIFRYRKNGERHAWSPDALRAMQQLRGGNLEAFTVVRDAVENTAPVSLKDLMEFRRLTAPVPLDEVEPVEQIRKRFTTAAMSLGALSPEAHETIALAMNRIGGKSNTGEGGEDAARFHARPDGESANSAIKQVASARFGVTAEYLANAKELEIKMAQGSKPGEGGQIPADKVTVQIAALRRSMPGIALISPPPHHDIYSIEDLAQLIYDLKQVNPRARISVKLVAEAGVGTIAAGVAKAYADIIQISGHEGGTGASPLSSVKNCGGPWELGLAEVRQVLVKNGLRDRVTLRVDGGFKTGRDIVIGAMLGAEEFNFGTAALIAIGCRYVRQCHLNTCPVGIATQDEKLRKKFPGTPEDLIRYFDAVAADVRTILASLGVRSVGEIIGRTDYLQQRAIPDHPKANSVDLSRILARDPSRRDGDTPAPGLQTGKADRPLDDDILFDVKDALREKIRTSRSYRVTNVNRSVGSKLSGEIAYLYGGEGLPPATIELRFQGSAGQSFGAFLVPGVRLILTGEANDYVGKGMSGGEIVIHAPATRVSPSEDVIAGNTVLYGATGGALFVAGRTGERFGVRNSGATAVCEGVGDHGCEYMTSGRVAVLGRAGRNFGAGMTGGRAYVLDVASDFRSRVNTDYVRVGPLADPADHRELQALIQRHRDATGSERARDLLAHWGDYSGMFWKVEPVA